MVRLEREHVEGIRKFILSFKDDQKALLEIKDAFIKFINDCVDEVI